MFNVFFKFAETIFIDIFLSIDAMIYSFISEMYKLYLQIANARIFTDEVIKDFADRIYIIIGMIALFLVTYALLQMVINPDKGKENGKQIVQRLVIALVLVPLVPLIFNFFYEFQNSILSNNVITNLILGTPSQQLLNQEKTPTYIDIKFYADLYGESTEVYACSTCELSDLESCDDYVQFKDEAAEGCVEGKILTETVYLDSEILRQEMIGNQMSYSLLNGFIYPTNGSYETKVSIDNGFFKDNAYLTYGEIGCAIGTTGSVIVTLVTGGLGAVTLGGVATACGASFLIGAATGTVADTVEDIFFTEDKSTMNDARNQIISTGDFGLISSYSKSIINGDINYMFFVSTIVGLFMLYLVFSFTLDLAVRAVKLAFYQLIAPVPIFLSIVPQKKELLNNWIKLILTTYAEVFIRIICFSAVAYFASSISDIITLNLGFLANTIIITGIVAFARLFPKLLGEVTGIKSEGMKLGITQKLADGGALVALGAARTATRAGVKNLNKARENGYGFWKGARSTLAGFGSGFIRGGKKNLSAKKFSEVTENVNQAVKDTTDARDKRFKRKARYSNEMKDYNTAKDEIYANAEMEKEAETAKLESALGRPLTRREKIARGIKHKLKTEKDVFIARSKAGKFGDYAYNLNDWAGTVENLSELDADLNYINKFNELKSSTAKAGVEMSKETALRNSSYVASKLEKNVDPSKKTMYITSGFTLGGYDEELERLKKDGFNAPFEVTYETLDYRHERDENGNVTNSVKINNREEFEKYVQSLKNNILRANKVIEFECAEAVHNGTEAIVEYLGGSDSQEVKDLGGKLHYLGNLGEANRIKSTNLYSSDPARHARLTGRSEKENPNDYGDFLKDSSDKLSNNKGKIEAQKEKIESSKQMREEEKSNKK